VRSIGRSGGSSPRYEPYRDDDDIDDADNSAGDLIVQEAGGSGSALERSLSRQDSNIDLENGEAMTLPRQRRRQNQGSSWLSELGQRIGLIRPDTSSVDEVDRDR
jgi:hypothetical protein